LILLDLLICEGKLVFVIHMAWFEGELEICLGLRGSWCFCLVYYISCFSLAFSSLT
jgi:hypothetical protein